MTEVLRTKISLFFLCAAVVFAGCASEPQSSDAAGQSEPQQEQQQPAPYFTGNGGEGTRIAVVQPRGTNIPQNGEWLWRYSRAR